MDAKRVLFVDDDALVAQLAGATLRRLGHHVDTFPDAASALAALRGAPGGYDVLMTDLRLGPCCGFELCEAARALCPGLPLVVTSGHVGPDEEARGRALGATVLPKARMVTTLPQVLARLFG